MSYSIWKQFTFDAAHRLPEVPADHKCHRIHGHTYTARIHLRVSDQEFDQNKGWVRDFSVLNAAWSPIGDDVDHQFLNEVVGLENPTSENIARWIGERVRKSLPELWKVEVCETASVGAVWYNDGPRVVMD